MIDKTIRRVVRSTLEIYREVDAPINHKIPSLPVTCTKGCAHCCYLLTFITFPEAVTIAERIARDPNLNLTLKSLKSRLLDQVTQLQKNLADRVAYFAARLPCAMLDVTTNTCRIYDERPMTCRAYWVVSDPALCGEGAAVSRVNFMNLEIYAVNEIARIVKRDVVPFGVSPFPIALLWALKLVFEGKKAFDQAISQDHLGIMDFDYWARLLHNQTGNPPPEVSPDPLAPSISETFSPDTAQSE